MAPCRVVIVGGISEFCEDWVARLDAWFAFPTRIVDPPESDADAAAKKDAASEASVVVCPPRSVRACNGVQGAPMTQCMCIVPCGANSENCSANECCAPVLDSYSSGQCISADAPDCRRSDGGIDAGDASGD